MSRARLVQDAPFFALREEGRRSMARDGWKMALYWLPGAYVTNGEHLYEVVYGCQMPGGPGWAALRRTDLVDAPADPYADERPERYAWSVSCWNHPSECRYRLVRPAPRLFRAAREDFPSPVPSGGHGIVQGMNSTPDLVFGILSFPDADGPVLAVSTRHDWEVEGRVSDFYDEATHAFIESSAAAHGIEVYELMESLYEFEGVDAAGLRAVLDATPGWTYDAAFAQYATGGSGSVL